MEHHERSLRRVEPVERSLDEVPIGELTLIVAAERLVVGLNFDLDGTSPTSASLIEAGIHKEAVEPRVEPVRITKSGQIAPGPHEGVLDRIARELAVPEDEARRRVHPSRRSRGKHGEGVVIASPRLLDELSEVHGPSPSPGAFGRSAGYGVGRL